MEEGSVVVAAAANGFSRLVLLASSLVLSAGRLPSPSTTDPCPPTWYSVPVRDPCASPPPATALSDRCIPCAPPPPPPPHPPPLPASQSLLPQNSVFSCSALILSAFSLSNSENLSRSWAFFSALRSAFLARLAATFS